MEKVSLHKGKAGGDQVGLPRLRTVQAPGMRGQIPHEIGKPLLTPTEKELWKKAGLREGELPPDISPENQRLIKAILTPEPIPSDKQRDLPAPKPVAIESLSKEKQEELVAVLSKARAQAPSLASIDDIPFISEDPGINNALALAQETAAKQPRRGKPVDDPANIKLIDDRPKMQAPAAEASPSESSSTMLPAKNCPHCGWDLAKEEDVVITPQDKHTYVAAMETGERFIKEYLLFGGKMKVTFRAVTAVESELVIRQLYIDNKSGKLNAPPEFYKKVREYRLALALGDLVFAGNPVKNLPTFEEGYEIDFTNEESTGLPELVEHLDKTVIKSETVRRVLLGAHERFDSLVHKIESKAYDADF